MLAANPREHQNEGPQNYDELPTPRLDMELVSIHSISVIQAFGVCRKSYQAYLECWVLRHLGPEPFWGPTSRVTSGPFSSRV